MDGDALISEQGEGVAILEGQLPYVTGTWSTQLAVAEQEPDCGGVGECGECECDGVEDVSVIVWRV